MNRLSLITPVRPAAAPPAVAPAALRGLVVLLLGGLGLLAGCTSKEQDATLKQMARYFDAGISSKVGYVHTTADNRESGKYLEVTIKDPAGIDPGNHDDLHFPASRAAYLLYRPDLRRGSSGYDFIRIVFDLDSEKSTFEYSYPTIRRYHAQFTRINKVLHSLHSKSFHEEYFNTSHIPPAGAHRIQEILRGINEDSLNLVGFKTSTVQSRPVFIIKANAHQPTRQLVISTDMDSTQAPIIGFTIGQPAD